MRSEGQIRHKLKQVLYRHLQKKLRDAFRPSECRFNKPVLFRGEKVGMCHFKNKGPHRIICDANMDGCIQQAASCEWFDGRREKLAIKNEFRELIKSDDRGRIANEYPDVAALMWVLDNRDGLIDDLNEIGDAVDNGSWDFDQPRSTHEQSATTDPAQVQSGGEGKNSPSNGTPGSSRDSSFPGDLKPGIGLD